MNLLTKTFSDPAVFWAAFQAIVTAMGVGIVFWQLHKLRRECVTHKFNVFQYVTNLLSSSEFKDNVFQFYTLLEKGNREKLNLTLSPHIISILRTLEIIDTLIKDGHFDEQVLFRIEGRRFVDLHKNLLLLREEGDNLSFENQIKLFPNGMDLLKRATIWGTVNDKRNKK